MTEYRHDYLVELAFPLIEGGHLAKGPVDPSTVLHGFSVESTTTRIGSRIYGIDAIVCGGQIVEIYTYYK